MKKGGHGVERKFTLITGATSGIGLELSKALERNICY